MYRIWNPAQMSHHEGLIKNLSGVRLRLSQRVCSEFMPTAWESPELINEAPVPVAMTELGARRVEQVLASITYGLPV
jgi:hypothetical protein